MKQSPLSLGFVAVLIMAWTLGRIQGQQESKVLFSDRAKANYSAMGENSAVTVAPIWGDPTKSARATFTKFQPGYDAGMHAHTNDVWTQSHRS